MNDKRKTAQRIISGEENLDQRKSHWIVRAIVIGTTALTISALLVFAGFVIFKSFQSVPVLVSDFANMGTFLRAGVMLLGVVVVIAIIAVWGYFHKR